MDVIVNTLPVERPNWGETARLRMFIWEKDHMRPLSDVVQGEWATESGS